MKIGVPKETYPGERRVALVPGVISGLTEAGAEVVVESGAGEEAGFPDEAYQQAGATIAQDRAQALSAELVAQVRTYGANPQEGHSDLEQLSSGQAVLGHAEPLTAHEPTKQLAEQGVTLLAMELMPRITRAQPMDALSSQANLAGYKSAILAAEALPKMLPMMMTAAGTIQPAKVFVIGAGVAGLQAIATAKRLGAQVSATDVRPATKEQVESLGGKFVMVEEAMVEEEGGYAKELTDEQKRKQQQLVADTVAESDVVITTAAIPGKEAPKLVSDEMVQRMRPRSVIVDLAAERGGNCELTEPNQVVSRHGVTIIGTENIPSTIAHDASQMYAHNITSLLKHLMADGQLTLDMDDEITAGVLVSRDGQVVHPKVRELMGLEPLEPAGSGSGDGGNEAGSGN